MTNTSINEHVYLGIKAYVVCINKFNGSEVWRAELKTSGLITLVVDGPLIIAHARGELFGLDRSSGQILWRNGLTGLGYGHCIIATEGADTTMQTQVAVKAIDDAVKSSRSSD